MSDKKKLSMQIGMMSVNSLNTIQPNYKTIENNNNWTNTIMNDPPKHNRKKYLFMIILFLCGLILVSTVKNKTRNIQKEINKLQTNLNSIQFNLDQAILDNEVITSPENISFLAKEYLNTELKFYQRSQIKKLNNEDKNLTKVSSLNPISTNNKNVKKTQKIMASTITKQIEVKKNEIKKLKRLYSQPKTIPAEVKKKITKKIDHAKNELKTLYKSPKEKKTLDKVARWSAIQVVKLFLGVPVVPGR